MSDTVCTVEAPLAKSAPWWRHPDARIERVRHGPSGDPTPPIVVIVNRCPHCGKEEPA